MRIKNLIILLIFFSISIKEHAENLKLDRLQNNWILITGCGRSGTEFMSVFLRTSGYDVNHEKPGNDGCVSWPMAANSYSPWGPQDDNDNFVHIFHQVRNPLDVITSWMTNYSDIERDEWVFIRKNIPEIDKNDSVIVHCAKYWYYWNLKAEAIAEWRYQIEDLINVLPEFKKRLGWDLDSNILESIPNNINSGTHITQRIYWSYLQLVLPEDLFINLQLMTSKYEYPISD